MLDFTVENHGGQGILRAALEGVPVGEIDFVRLPGGVADIHHTGVDPQFEGRGFGKELVAAAVNLARQEGWKLRASCPYAAKVLARNPDYQDVREDTPPAT